MMEDIKMSMTKAQLEEALAKAEAALENAKNATKRQRFYSNLWPNLDRRTDNDPAWRGTIDFVVPEGVKPGDRLWLDLSQWEADPARFKKNPPDFSVSMSQTDAEFAEVLEKRRVEALKQRARAH